MSAVDVARALTGDTAPLEQAQEFLGRFRAALRRGVPERALLVVLHGDAEKGIAWQAVSPWITGRGLYVLSGPRGTGKTVAAARWAAVTGARWEPASAAWEAGRQDDLARAPSLVIDEIGGHGSTSDTAIQRLGALLSRRHADRLATVLTTNLDREATGSLFDGDWMHSRILDRIDEDGAWVTVTQRMRHPDATARRARVDAAERLVSVWGQVDGVAMGADDHGAIASLQRLLGVTDADIEKTLAQQRSTQALIASFVRKLEVS